MTFDQLNQREFMSLLGGAIVAWPFAVRAHEPERVRRIGALINLSVDDPLSETVIGAFSQGLQEHGWYLGRNIRIDYRWAVVDGDRIRQYAMDLVALAPDVVLAFGSTASRAIQRETLGLPIVFVNATDPIGAGLVSSLGEPGGNATGFLSIEYGMSTKWLELLKQIAPHVIRAAVLRDPTSVGGAGQFGLLQGAAPSFGMDVSPIDIRKAGDIDHGVSRLARGSNVGLIVTTNRLGRFHRDLIIKLANRYELPTVYPNRYYIISGGLISYGADLVEQLRQAAGYIARILKGEKPASLPVQAPTKYELVINLRTAKTLGLNVPPTLLARADEVIE